MQLRVPKKYRSERRRRRLGGPSPSIFRLLLLVALVVFGYWLVRHPEEARTRAEDTIATVSSEFNLRRQEYFPPEPTPTPDVRTETIECENAYIRGDMEDAIIACRQAIKGRPNDVDLHYRLAHTLIITSDLGENTERLEEAVEVAERAINADPENYLGWAIEAMALDWSQEWGKALGYAERALELAPDSVLSQAITANIYRNVGQFERAQATINEAVSSLEQLPNPDPEIVAQVYRNYARMMVAQGDFESAIQPYNIAYDAMPTHTYIAVELASLVHFPLNQFTQAASVLERVRDNTPRDPASLYWLSIVYLQSGETDSAAEVLTVCIDANPNYIPCRSSFGRLQYHRQNYNQAIDILEPATALGSTDPYDWFLLGRAYYRTQRCSEAAEPLRQGYLLRQEIDTTDVTLEDFVQAGQDCSITLQ